MSDVIISSNNNNTMPDVCNSNTTMLLDAIPIQLDPSTTEYDLTMAILAIVTQTTTQQQNADQRSHTVYVRYQ